MNLHSPPKTEVPYRRDLEVFRYHASANKILCAGAVSGLVFVYAGWLQPWTGFLVGAIPAFLTSVIAHGLSDNQ